MKLPLELNEELRSKYDAVKPGWHMNKKYWSSVYPDRDLRDKEIYALIKKAYDTVVATLPKKEQEKIYSHTK